MTNRELAARLFGLLLAAVAVQFIINALEELLKKLTV